MATDEIPLVNINHFGVIPKHHQANKWRLIVDLSHPEGFSINDNIPSHLCRLSYITVDDAIQEILKTGPGTLLVKVDIKNAFCLLLMHPADRGLLGMKWRNMVYIDTCLPFGLRSAPQFFNILADLLTWSAQLSGVSFVIHYIDDFLTVGPPSSDTCQQNLTHLCDDLGVPLTLERWKGHPPQFLSWECFWILHAWRSDSLEISWCESKTPCPLGWERKKPQNRIYFP